MGNNSQTTKEKTFEKLQLKDYFKHERNHRRCDTRDEETA